MVLDLCSGLGGFSEAFLTRGHYVIRLDNDKHFEKVDRTITIDVCDVDTILTLWGNPDVILASPDCSCFSMGSQRHHFEKIGEQYLPKTTKAIKDMNVIYSILYLIQKTKPHFWFLENPRATLHKFIGEARGWVSYCQYDNLRRMKPTSLWGVHPDNFKYRHCFYLADCHEHTPRSSKGGTQGIKGSENRAKIPYELSEEICLACEEELE